MGLAEIVRGGVALANRQTASLQVSVQHAAWTGQDQYGAPTFATAVARPALVEMKQQLRRDSAGHEVMQRAAVTFIGPVPGNGAEGRREPIDPRDRLTLPDGTTGPILDVRGLADPATNNPYLYECALG